MLLKQSMKKKKCFAKNDKNILQQIIYILQEFFFFYYQVLVKVLGQEREREEPTNNFTLWHFKNMGFTAILFKKITQTNYNFSPSN